MKGVLKNKKNEWIVAYWDKMLPPNEIRSILTELPLHPDDTKIPHISDSEVEFKIVIDYLPCKTPEICKNQQYCEGCDGIKVAKLITKQGSVDEEGYGITRVIDDKQEESSNWDEIFKIWRTTKNLDNYEISYNDWLKEYYLPPVKR